MSPQPEIVIRPRADDDLPALADILREVHATDGYPVEGVDDPLAWLQSHNLVEAWTAIVNGHVVGQVALNQSTPGDFAPGLARQAGIDDSLLVLGRLFVSVRARGHSIGTILTQAATKRARQLGARAVLDVMEKDVAAIRTYERLG